MEKQSINLLCRAATARTLPLPLPLHSTRGMQHEACNSTSKAALCVAVKEEESKKKREKRASKLAAKDAQ